MKVKGTMNDSPFVLEENVVMATCRLCDAFKRGNPQVVEEDNSVIATNDIGTILFRGTPAEMLLFKEAIKLVISRYELIQKLGKGSPSERMVRIGLDNFKDDIANAMEFKKQCSPKSSLTDAFGKMSESSYA